MHKVLSISFIILFLIFAAPLSAQNTESSSTPKTHRKFKDALPPARGFHWSVEWNGEYGGTDNYVDHTHWGIHFKGNLLNRNAVHINTGYQFNPYLYVGAGTGIEYQDRGYGDIFSTASPALYVGALWVVPVYGEIRGYLLNKPTTPFLQLRVGYAPSIYAAEKRYVAESSSYNNLSIGVRIYSHLSITAGYLFMYQPAYLTGYDKYDNTEVIDREHPYQHYCTIGTTVNF